MSADFDVSQHVLYQLRNASVRCWPFPHFFVRDVFPTDFYRNLVKKVSENREFKDARGRYHGRTFGNPDDISGLEFMRTKEFLQNICAIFKNEMRERFPDGNASLYTDLRLIRDGKGYSIGPHTDAPWKLVSLLFYLPEFPSHSAHGTSIYVPHDPAFRCQGGPHHPFDKFRRVSMAPYIPNSCMGFFKTDKSFHGVEPIDDAFERNVLLYNIYDQKLYSQSVKPAAPE